MASCANHPFKQSLTDHLLNNKDGDYNQMVRLLMNIRSTAQHHSIQVYIDTQRYIRTYVYSTVIDLSHHCSL